MAAPLERPHVSRKSKRQLLEEADEEDEEDARAEALQDNQRKPAAKKTPRTKESPLTECVRSCPDAHRD